MFKTNISVDWDGSLYNCDFNQMLELKIVETIYGSIKQFDYKKLRNRDIVVHNHCYGCVAGSGSSCQGSTTDE